MVKLLMAIVLALSFSPLPAGAILLVYKPPSASGLRYQQTCDITLQLSTTAGPASPVDSRQTQNSIYRETAAATDPDGTLSLVRRMESGSLTLQPEPTPPVTYTLPKVQSFLRLTSRGRMLSAQTFLDPAGEGDSPPPAELDLSYLTLDLATLEILLSHIPFPEGPVQIDQVWSEKFRLPNFLGAAATPVALTSRLLEIGPYQGKKCAKIRTSFELPFYWQYPQMLDRLRIPQEARDNLTTQGNIVGRLEWWFDIEQGHSGSYE
jgi:hypothetical protein